MKAIETELGIKLSITYVTHVTYTYTIHTYGIYNVTYNVTHVNSRIFSIAQK